MVLFQTRVKKLANNSSLNSADPEQTAPEGAVWSGPSLFLILRSFFGVQRPHNDQILVEISMRKSVGIYRTFTLLSAETTSAFSVTLKAPWWQDCISFKWFSESEKSFSHFFTILPSDNLSHMSCKVPLPNTPCYKKSENNGMLVSLDGALKDNK